MNQNLQNIQQEVIARANRKKPPYKVNSMLAEVNTNEHVETPATNNNNVDNDNLYKNLNWLQVPHLQRKPYKTLRPSKALKNKS
jgi:hypothetical protein